MKLILSALLITSSLFPTFASGAELYQELQETFRAEVMRVIEQKSEEVPGLGITAETQQIEIRILSGSKEGSIVEIRNDRLMLEEGDTFFLDYLKTLEGEELFLVQEPDRSPLLIFMVLLFITTVIIFGGKQGVRSLVSLVASFVIIFYLLLPNLLNGVSPILVGLGFSVLIMVLAILLTHGVNRKSLSALSGTIITIVLAFVLADWAVSAAKLTGVTEDASLYLNLNTGGTLNLTGLLLTAIIIGVLGILDDIAITQASVVSELHQTATNLSRREIYGKAMNVGREHVSALINTLALAYTGAAMPLLLFFYSAQAPLVQIISREVFVTEIIRIIIGSIAVILTVPITTLIACMVIIREDLPLE